MTTTPYATVIELDEWIASANSDDSVELATIEAVAERALTAASNAIDDHCRRVFYRVTTGDAEERSYRALSGEYTRIDDCYELDAVTVDTNGDNSFAAWVDGTDYQTLPLNGVRHGRTGWPVDMLQAVGDTDFYTGTRAVTVKVTGKWGWNAVPDEVVQATLIKAHRVLLRPKTPHGVAGFSGFGEIRLSREDQDVINLLEPFVIRTKPGIA